MVLKPLFSRLSLGISSLVVVVVLGEVVVRVVEWASGTSEEYQWSAASRWRAVHRLVDNRDLLYDLAPNSSATIDYGPRGKVEYRISSQGVRGQTRSMPRPEGVRRVLILGDSVTFGYYVPEESTFVSLLEQTLRRSDPGIEVINGGVGGYNTHNEMAWLIARGLAFEPDVVVLAFCPNDVDNPYSHFSWHTLDRLGPLPPALFPDPSMAHHEAPSPGGLWFTLRKHSRFAAQLDARLSLLRTSLATSAALRGGARATAALRALPYGDCITALCDDASPRRAWLASHLSSLDSLSAAHRFAWILLYLPLSYQAPEGPGSCARNELNSLALALNVPFVDPLTIQPPPGRLFYDPTHLTPAGHRWLAAALREPVSQALSTPGARGDSLVP